MHFIRHRSHLVFSTVIGLSSACDAPGETTTAAGETTSAASPSTSTPAPDPVAAEPPTVPSAVPSTVASANLSMGSGEFDGMKFEGISCQATEGGLFASAAIFGVLAKQKQAFTACTGGANVRVHFSSDGATVTDIRVADAANPKAAACVQQELSKAKLPAGTCVATLHLGF